MNEQPASNWWWGLIASGIATLVGCGILIDLSARLHQIWAMIPKKLIDEIEKGVSKKELKSEIRELLFCHPMWGGQPKDTKEFANVIVLLFDILEFRRDN